MDNQPFQPSYGNQPMQNQSQSGPMGQSQMAQPMGGSFSSPMQQTARLVPGAKPGANKSTIYMILLIIVSLVAVTFIALFIWMFSKWDTAQSDVDSQVSAAVASAVNEKAEELENQFTEREKQPYQLFAGPADYGELSFEYPKTWSVYEAKAATSGGDYEAYLNPGKVYPIGNDTINALRVIIKDQAYDTYIKAYDNYVKNGRLTVSVRPINGENANLYTGELPGTKLQGIVAVFKIRDKAAVLQTDAMIFEQDFQRVLDTVRYNQ